MNTSVVELIKLAIDLPRNSTFTVDGMKFLVYINSKYPPINDVCNPIFNGMIWLKTGNYDISFTHKENGGHEISVFYHGYFVERWADDNYVLANHRI